METYYNSLKGRVVSCSQPSLDGLSFHIYKYQVSMVSNMDKENEFNFGKNNLVFYYIYK